MTQAQLGTRPTASVTARFLVLFAVAVLLVIGGLTLGLREVEGLCYGESCSCGSPFSYDNSGGYGGSLGFADCESAREARQPLAWGTIALGVGLGIYTVWADRRSLRTSGFPRRRSTYVIVVLGGLLVVVCVVGIGQRTEWRFLEGNQDADLIVLTGSAVPRLVD